MAELSAAEPVKMFTGIIYGNEKALLSARTFLEKALGPLDYESSAMPFNFTTYYEEEMGSPLFRIFYSFERLAQPDDLIEIKLMTNELEKALMTDGKRTVNIDPGSIDYFKVVLPSAKYGGQKIYLGKGIWGDLTLVYEKGTFKPLPWAFPDFGGGAYDDILLAIRSLYKKQMKSARMDEAHSCPAFGCGIKEDGKVRELR
jgi:hypothetical protein